MEGGRGSGGGDDVMSGEMESALAEGRKERGTCSPPLKLPRTSESLELIDHVHTTQKLHISGKLVKDIRASQD